jgi:DNA-binding transcriptional regulator/RsmH inhibitor MraZ
MYFDSYNVQVDKQGRITLPTGLFRSGDIERGSVLCVYRLQNYWVACDPGRLKQILETEFPGRSIDPETRNDRRDFMMAVTSLHIDLQGRVQFQHLDTVSGAGRYMLIGTGFDFEIWPLQVWQERFEKLEERNEQREGQSKTNKR